MSLFSSILLLCSVATSNVSPITSPAMNVSINNTKSSYQLIYTPTGGSPDFYEDIYETNNNVDTATRLIPNNFYTYNSYQIQILQASLYRQFGINDIDYYYFTLFTDTYVGISFINGTGFYFDLMAYNYLYASDEYVNRTLNTTSSNLVSNSLLNFEGILKAGTYFIVLRLGNEISTDCVIHYSFNVNLTKSTTGYVDVSIADLRFNKGLGAVAWVSDLQPAGTTHSFDALYAPVYYQYNKTGVHEPEYCLDEMKRVSGGNPIHLSSFYIWDKDLIDALHYAYHAFREQFAQQVGQVDKLNCQLDVAYTVTSKSIDIAFTAIGIFVPMSIPAGIALALINKGLVLLLKCIIDCVRPNIEVDCLQYFSYLDRLIGLTANRTNGEVIHIPYYYSLITKSHVIPANEKRIISFQPTIYTTQNIDDYIYLSDEVSYIAYDSYHTRGKFYSLSYSNGDLNTIQFVNVLNIDNITPISLAVDSIFPSTIDALRYGEYAWRHFIAPAEGNYSFFVNNPNATISVFSSVVDGYSNLGRITYSTEIIYNDADEALGVSYEKHMATGETLYFRIRGVNYAALTASSFSVYNFYLSDIYHNHRYDTNYIWMNLYQHQAYCRCGHVTLKGHVVSAGGGGILNGGIIGGRTFCILCGGEAVGLVGPLTTNSIASHYEDIIYFGNDSYIYNGIVYLSNFDLSLFYQNLLIIPEY